MKRIAILVSLIALALPASAGGLVDSNYIIPSSANVQGAFGAYFKTKVTIFNNNAQPLSLFVVLGTPTGAISQSISVPASTFFTYQNFLEEVFGYVGGGAIGIVDTNGRTFGVVAEVYVDGPNGRYSTPLMLPTFDDAVVRPGDSGRSVAFGLHAEAGNRVNFGCTNLAVVPATVRASVNAITNGVRTTASVDLNLTAQSWQQVASPITGDRMYVDFRVTSGGDRTFPVYCYAVNVNNASNDGTEIPVERMP